MPYREVYLAGGEVAIARISDEAIIEWIEVRERNKTIGYPDRPPDIDNEFMRSWIQHPGDPGYEELRKRALVNSFPVITIAEEDIYKGWVIEAKLLIGFNEGEGYTFRMVVRGIATGETLLDKISVKAEWDEQYYENVLTLYSNMFIHPHSDPPLISTYLDYEEMQAESILAEQELKEYYDGLRLN